MKAELLEEVIQLRKAAWKAAGDSSDLGLCGTVIREHQSFRLLASAESDPLIGFRVLRRLHARWKNRSGYEPRRNGDATILVMDGVSRNREAVLSYVETMLQAKAGHFISRDDLPGRLHFVSSKWPVRFWRYALAACVRCLFSSRRFHHAVGIFQVAELCILLEYLEREGVKHVVDFAPYVLDSNLCYLLLKERGIHTTKVPSPGPLATHNHILLADTAVISTPYHAFEMEQFRETFRVQRTEKWIPERTQNYINRYRFNRPETQKGCIGYYSHGSWVRSDAGHTSDGLGLHEKEDRLLDMLGAVLIRHPEWRLRVFPHPREKKPEILERTRAYYQSHLGDIDFEISLDELPTALQFEAAELGVAVFSTIIYERLFSGYKTLIYRDSADAFPDSRTSLFQIAVDGEAGLESGMVQWMGSEEEDYFSTTGMEGYRWTSYDNLPQADSESL